MTDLKNAKIAVINFSGNVGKSTVSKHLLVPRMEGATLLAVETINADEGADLTVNGAQFGDVQAALLTADGAVLDIGASNVEAVMGMMGKYKGSHEDFDLFVIPVTKDDKQLRDTIGTIMALARMGVSGKRIVVVMNQVEPGEKVEEAFAGLFAFHAASGGFTLRPQAAIYFNEVYQKSREVGLSVSELGADETDWKAVIRETADPQVKADAVQRLMLRRLALSANENLDTVFAALAA